MEAFEAVVSMLLRHQGYWTTPNYKVSLTKRELAKIGKPTSPRREIDVLAFKGSTNEVLAVECKSFLNSQGVTYRDGQFYRTSTYKIFHDQTLRNVVLRRLAKQLVKNGLCATIPKVRLCLAAGKIASVTDRPALKTLFDKNGWRFFDPEQICKWLEEAALSGYENDIAFVVSKLLRQCKSKK